tara:strand:- start:2155 stop:2364 length:210 start_codon:yes stop_codon:yes gene_type:complete
MSDEKKKQKSMRVVDEDLVEQMYNALMGLNEGMTEMYKLNMHHAKLIKELHERVLKLEKNQQLSSIKIK